MDILIKNMKMPKNCLSCPMKEHCQLFNALHFNERLKMLDVSIRVDGCPLVALPPSHGRLIIADALLEKLEKIVLPDDLTYTIAHGILKQIIEDAPTIVEATE